MNIKCFLLTATGKTSQYIRRYHYNESQPCPVHGYCHQAHKQIEDGKVDADGYIRGDDDAELIAKHIDTVLTHCDCGFEFTERDLQSIFKKEQYVTADGRIMTIEDAQVGAMWRGWWYEDHYKGLDGMCYVVKTPGGDWIIDSRASNCTMPKDNEHKCWCREGIAPNFTVNKNGNTCKAGAGSILIGNYHGFLIKGELVSC